MSAAIFLTLSFIVMQHGHLHEDAYILYIYSENFAKTGVINYYSGGPPTEGATDFLWMILIALLNYFGIPSGVASSILNTIGVFLVTFVFALCASRQELNRFVLLLITIFVPISNIGQAAFMGFSTALYSAVIAGLVYFGMFGKGRSILLVPVLGLVLALLRPDGAIIGGLTALLILTAVERHMKARYLLVSLGGAVVGMAYFVWRWNYFGEILPLPLIVKSSSDVLLPGLGTNMKWMFYVAPLLGLACSSAFFLKGCYLRALAVSAPILIYFISISFAAQSQNVGHRFQAPMLVLIIFFAALALSSIWGKEKNIRRNKLTKSASIFAIIFPIFIFSANDARVSALMIRSAIKGEYIDVFPYFLSEHLYSDSTIVLTEAGRLAYWTPGRKYDLVGLNTAETAVNGATVEYLRNADADLIMIHQANTLNGVTCPEFQDFCRLSSEDFTEAFETGRAPSVIFSENRVLKAPAVTAQFLIENFQDFAVYAVRYGDGYSHIYAVRGFGALGVKEFEGTLMRSFDEGSRLSYLQMVSWRQK
ncbi:MAG TPA: hypothetical protein DCE52_17565 [Rhodobacteraceae bacterium]|nr:hypothetical protein [Paracoccaceae bacterium]